MLQKEISAMATLSEARSPVLPIVRGVLTDAIYDSVKSQLMDSTIQPGSLLNMAQLARTLMVSTTPLREALARLEAEGLLLVKPLQGYRAAPMLDLEGVNQLFRVRIALEPIAAESTAANHDADRIVQLAESIRRMDEITHGAPLSGDYHRYRSFADEDANFHAQLAEGSGNALLARTIDSLHAHVHLYRLYFSAGIAPETTHEHLQVQLAVERGDEAAARAAMANHLENSWARIRSAFVDS